MNHPPLDERQLAYLSEQYGLSAAELGRLLDDVWSFTDQTSAAWVTDRHRQLQAEGLDNPRIYKRLERELVEGRFKGGHFSLRQIRRMIYG